MNTAIIGYGKMGKEIEKILHQRGHTQISIFDETPSSEDLQNVDVAIEFTQPDVAYENIVHCLQNNVAVVCGTTGWLDKYDDIVEYCQQHNGSFLHASNFSLGVNLFFELNKRLAQLMHHHPSYTPSIEEIHHTEKKDIPSGTAIALALPLMDIYRYKDWVVNKEEDDENLSIHAKREPKVPGTHIVSYSSKIDTIEIKHIAKSREGFALGAVLAAEYIHNKKGVFTINEVLNIS